MTKRARSSFIALLALASLAGPEACKGNAQCLRHTDCNREESCDLGTCVIKSTPGSELGDAGAGASSAQGGSTGGRVTATGGTLATGGRPITGAEAGNGGDAGGADGNTADAGAGG